MNQPTPRAHIGVVGAGMVFDAYARGLAWYGDLPVIRIADIDVGRARAKAELHGVPAYGTLRSSTPTRTSTSSSTSRPLPPIGR